MRKATLFVLLFFFSLYHPAVGQSRGDSTLLPCQQNAGHLLDEALTCMKKHYYRKDWIQWEDLTNAARTRLRVSGKCDDANEVIGWCFEQLNEQHSFLMAPARAARYNFDTTNLSGAPAPSLSELVGEIKGEWLHDSIAYLTIPWVSTTDSLICAHIADSLQELIARLDSRGITRWIIDLRKNSGGNCWPMLAGIGPLLGEGVCGYFVAAEERIPISYRDGAAFQGRHIGCRVSREGYRTQFARKSIVVLTSRRTVSAGEIVAMAFKGKDQAYLFGEPTAGLTTANATYSLSDHSMLVLSVCREADHTGRIWEGSIVPDKVISSASQAGLAVQDPVKAAAIDWLQSR